MSALKTFLAPAFLGATMALSAGSAIAMSEGDSGSFTDITAKLAGEQQTEFMAAAAGSSANVRGVQFYYNKITKVGYIALTDKYVGPTTMKIIRKTTGTDFVGPVVVPQPQAGIQECKKIVSERPSKADDCASLYSKMKDLHDKGMSFFQQGKLENGSNQIILLNPELGQGGIFESTPNGATVTTLPFAAAKYTAEGARLFPK